MTYLSEEEIVALNVCVQKRYGQEATIRDAGALDYIVRSAQQEVFGRRLYATVPDLAVFYFVKLIKKHIFNDCNKRTGYLALLDCLAQNGVVFHPTAAQRRRLADLAIHVAQVDGEPQDLWQDVRAAVREMLA
ncbi:type II toxin-antitoxin system death-on-curing family toxin [Lacticaseibacillus kribbianus]|uniref:type II toxin-antitoxin system death-on-curing family toxin n=1 Tax=Lacticaseibacillus kribbianus TaxID=2926292 RepID=UPI001CD1E352|nr:type II toxin-antitoxin system death-on-curing family toxin [Lacticaseibacillus kribbianus]